MDVELILEKLEAMDLVRLGKVTGSYHQVHCPFHNNGQERKPSCGVLLQDEYRNNNHYPQGLWHCFSCGAAKSMEEAVTEILKNHHISQSGLDWLIENIPGFQPDKEKEAERLIPDGLSQALTNKFALNYIHEQLKKPVQTFISEEELASYRYTVPYMEQRGLTPELIEAYDIGVDMKFVPPGRKNPVPSITFPVRDKKGRTLFICRRSIEGKFFNYPENVQKPVYGIDMIPPGCRSLVIAESCFNCLTIVKYGHPAVALLGTGNPYQIQQLKELGVSEFVLCFDGDEAGHKATARLKKALHSVGLVWVMNMPDGKDANDLDYETFEEIYNNRE